MSNFRRLLVLVLGSLLIACTESGISRLTIVTSGRHEVTSGVTVPGDLIMLGGELVLAAGSRIDGTLTIVSGTITVDGEVAGDTVLVNGTATLGPSARLGGDLTVAGGVIRRSPEATIAGQIRRDPAGPFLDAVVPNQSSPIERIARAVVSALLLALGAALGIAFAPARIERTAATAIRQPLPSIAIGALTGLVVLTVLVLMAFTVVLIPLVIVGALILTLAILLGWIALGLAAGRRVSRRLPIAAVLGTLVLSLVVQATTVIPVLGSIVLLTGTALALGAAVLSKDGTRVFVPESDRPAE